MFQGFYNLTSGMLTQTRKLNVISNNMANVTTPGFKSDTFIQKSFQEEMMYRTGNLHKHTPQRIGSMTWKVVADGNVTNYSSSGFSTTINPLDICIVGDGFFQVKTEGGMVYTRDGSFSLDDEGYLYLAGLGRVQGESGDIKLSSDSVSIDPDGSIVDTDQGTIVGKLKLVDFADYAAQLTKAPGNAFMATGQTRQAQATVRQSSLEDSNVDAISEMTDMMSAQRALQSAAQVLSMYDKLSAKIVEIGPA